jgi:uncharacterized protein YdgA (DUF945 family)
MARLGTLSQITYRVHVDAWTGAAVKLPQRKWVKKKERHSSHQLTIQFQSRVPSGSTEQAKSKKSAKRKTGCDHMPRIGKKAA